MLHYDFLNRWCYKIKSKILVCGEIEIINETQYEYFLNKQLTDRWPSWCSGKYLYKYSDAISWRTVSPKNSNLWLEPKAKLVYPTLRSVKALANSRICLNSTFIDSSNLTSFLSISNFSIQWRSPMGSCSWRGCDGRFTQTWCRSGLSRKNALQNTLSATCWPI